MSDIANLSKQIRDYFTDKSLPEWSSLTINVDFIDGIDEAADIDVMINYSDPGRREFYESDNKLVNLVETLGRVIAKEHEEQGILTEYDFTLNEDKEASLNVSFNRHQGTI